MTLDNLGTWLEIDLSVLKNNFQVLSDLTGKQVMPIVKANAYGHGLERVAEAFAEAGAEWFGVARIEEALLLRESGIEANILVLGYSPPSRVSHAIKENISLAVYDQTVAEAFAGEAAHLKEEVRLHAKIETGMGRLGIPHAEALPFIEFVSEQKFLKLEGIFTHFACADEPDKAVTREQIERFNQVLGEVRNRGIDPGIIHASNSAGALNFPEARYDLIRGGIALYGHPPTAGMALPKGIQPALYWKTRLISIKELPAGHGVSYGHRYHTTQRQNVGVIAAGYGDGLRRVDGNDVLIRGKRIPIIGTVCMDQCMVDLADLPDAEIGDEVVIIGAQNDAEISATDTAQRWGTINYEVLCGLAARMPRHYTINMKNYAD